MQSRMLRNSVLRDSIIRYSSLKTNVSGRLFCASASAPSPLRTTTLDDSLETLISEFPIERVSEPRRSIKLNVLTSSRPISALKYLQQRTALKVKKTSKLLKYSEENFTAEDYSIFVNRLFHLVKKDDQRLQSPEMWKSLYHIYRIFVVNNCSERLNALIVHDLNKFIGVFIHLNDLPSARGAFKLILRNSEKGEMPKDVETINTFLRLYCGASSKYWKHEPTMARDFYQKLILSVSSPNLTHICYPTIGVPQFQSLLRKILEEPEYAVLRNTEMDSLIIHALGHYNEMPFLKKYLTLLYGVGEESTIVVPDTLVTKVTPDSKLLSSILTAYAHNKDLESGICIVEELLSKNPDTVLDSYFWRTLLKYSLQSWKKYDDKKGTLPTKAWNMMISYYMSKGKSVPFDRKTMLFRLLFIKSTKNYVAAMDDVKQVFQSIFYKAEKNAFIVERLVLYDYQKFIVRSLVNRSENAACIDFINEWKIDYENGIFLENYFKHITETQAKNGRENKKLNDADEDDFNFPVLGTNIL